MSRVHERVVFLALVVTSAGSLAAQPFNCSISSGVPPLVRSESLKERAGDVVLLCVGGTATPAGVPVPQVDIRAFLNTNLTSRLLGGFNEALLLIDEPFPANQHLCEPAPCSILGVNPSITPGSGPGVNYQAAGVPNVFQGIPVTGTPNAVEWRSVPLDQPGLGTTRIARLTNIYANAALLGVSTTLIPTQILIFVTMSVVGGNPAPINNPTQSVAFVLPSLSFSVTGATPCANGSRTATLNFIERYPTALTRRSDSLDPTVLAAQNLPGVIYSTQTGFYHPSLVTQMGLVPANHAREAGAASWGTRLMAIFGGIPLGGSVTVGTLNNGATGRVPFGHQAELHNGRAAATFSPATSGALPVSGGGEALAIWEVTADSPIAAQNYAFNVTLSCTAGTPTIVLGGFAPYYSPHSRPPLGRMGMAIDDPVGPRFQQNLTKVVF